MECRERMTSSRSEPRNWHCSATQTLPAGENMSLRFSWHKYMVVTMNATSVVDLNGKIKKQIAPLMRRHHMTLS